MIFNLSSDRNAVKSGEYVTELRAVDRVVVEKVLAHLRACCSRSNPEIPSIGPQALRACFSEIYLSLNTSLEAARESTPDLVIGKPKKVLLDASDRFYSPLKIFLEDRGWVVEYKENDKK